MTFDLNKARRQMQEPMTDGGMEMPEYLTEEDPDWNSFTAHVAYSIPGTVVESIEDDDLPRSRGQFGDLRDAAKKEMKFSEPLNANIINLESWLRDDWLEMMGMSEEMDIGGKRTFLANLQEAEIHIELQTSEIVKAARQRGKEDARHFLYVIGSWTYLAEKHDHVSDMTASRLRGAFEESKKAAISPPTDATCDEYRGGYDGY
jgi:hypothetical protein